MEIADIERQVFRKIISNPESLAVNISKVSAEDFQNKLAKIVIGALSANGYVAHFSPNKNFFELLLRDRIKDASELDRVSTVLEKMANAPEDAGDLELLIKEVKANRMCREMTRVIQDHIENITPEKIEGTYESMVRDMLKLPLSAAAGVTVSTVREVHQELEQRMALYTSPMSERFPTGISAFDSAIGGFAPGEFVVITAGTGQGKSNLMLWWAEQYVKNGANVAYVTIEMSYEQTMTRYHSVATGFDVTEIGNRRIPEGRLGEYYRKLILHAKDPSCREELGKKLAMVVEQTPTALMAVANEYPNRSNKMFIIDIGAASPGRVEREVQRLAMDHKIDYVFVDFINVMDPEFHNRDKVKELASIARDLKKVARRTKTILFTAAQLDTTSIEGKSQNEVIAPDRVKYAKAIGENADWMIAFHRTEEDKRLKQIRLQMAKHRMAGDTAALLEFDFATMQAIDLGSPDPAKASDMGSADNSKYRAPEPAAAPAQRSFGGGGWTQEPDSD